MTQTHTTTSKQKAAEITGFQVERIGVVRLQLEELLQEGILIDLNIQGESLFTRQFDWADAGIPLDSARARRLTRGQKYLFDETLVKSLKSITASMRQFYAECTFKTAATGGFGYLNYKRYDSFVKGWAELKARFYAAKQIILDAYTEAVDAIAADFNQIAHESWIAQNRDNCLAPDGKLYDDEYDFTDAVVRVALAKMPTVERIEQELHADYRVYVLQGAEQIARDQAAAEQINAHAEAARQSEYLQVSLVQERYDHERRMNQLAEAEKQARIDAMFHAEAEHVREQLTLEDDPVLQMFTQVRAEVAQVCADACDTINKSGAIHGNLAKRLRGLLEFYDLRNVVDDRKLHEKLVELKNLIGTVGEDRQADAPKRDTGSVLSALQSISGMVETARVDLKAEPSRFSFID